MVQIKCRGNRDQDPIRLTLYSPLESRGKFEDTYGDRYFLGFTVEDPLFPIQEYVGVTKQQALRFAKAIIAELEG